MERVAVTVIEKMFVNSMIDEDDKELYVYSLQVLLEKILGFSIIFMISIKFDLFIQSILFVYFFSNIRKHSSGFHLSKFYTCLLTSTGIFVLYAKFIYRFLLFHIWINYFCLFFGLLVILCIGAVNNPNINWTSSEQQENMKIAKSIAIIETIIILLLDFLKMDNSYLLFMSFGIILSAILLLIEKIRREVYVK